MEAKAIVFTHLPIRVDKPEDRYTRRRAYNLINDNQPYFERYLCCRNIALVYVYVDTGLRLTLRHLSTDEPLEYSIAELEFEQITRNCLKLAVDQAVRDLKSSNDSSFDRAQAPRFQFVGLPHLVSLIHSLYRDNPGLLADLAGAERRFTYDSPKFVEALIRLVRGGDYPVLRFDADVEVNERGVEFLLQSIRRLRGLRINYSLFFSLRGLW